MEIPVRFQRILGVRFVVCNASDFIDRICRQGGLVVMPSGPGMTLLDTDTVYRDAILGADLALPDSSFMVMVWNLLSKRQIAKFSGLKYLRSLLQKPCFRSPGSTLWVMPSASSAYRNAVWLRDRGIELSNQEIYVAPIYGAMVEDPVLLGLVEQRRPRHVVLCLAGGVQEKLGFYLKVNLDLGVHGLPAIHCIGAAIGFLSGDQVHIPVWVDRAGLGWLWRIASNPLAYAPRYWTARRLAGMILRYRDRLPFPSPEALAHLPASPLKH